MMINLQYINFMKIDSQQLVLFFEHEINALRRNPRQFTSKLYNRLKLFKDQHCYERADIHNILYRTQQGKSAVNQAIKVLQNNHPGCSPLHLSVQLCQVAYKMSLTLDKTAQITNFPLFKKQLKEELNHLQCQINQLQILIQYGFRKDQQLIPTLVVDDGNHLRTRRHAILNEKYKYLGICVQQHSQYDYYILILLTDRLISHKIEVDSHCKCSLI